MTDDQNLTGQQQDPISEENTQSEAAALQEELAQMTAMAQRAAADLANYKRHVEEQRAEMMAFANKHLLQAIFPAIDNLTRAAQNMPKDMAQNEWAQGVLKVEKQLLDALASLGLTAIEEAGVSMDPMQHEVLMEAPGEKGQVVQVFEKGYSFNGKTIRAAKVSVGNGN